MCSNGKIRSVQRERENVILDSVVQQIWKPFYVFAIKYMSSCNTEVEVNNLRYSSDRSGDGEYKCCGGKSFVNYSHWDDDANLLIAFALC